MHGMQRMLGTEVRLLARSSRSTLPQVISRRAMASALRNETLEQRKARKDEIKAQKADKRARREGHVPDYYGQKPCSLCKHKKDLLIR